MKLQYFHSIKINEFPLLLLDGCNRENFRGYEWPEINLGTSASVPCPCAEYSGSLAGRIFRYCTGTFSQQAQWSTTLDSSRCTALNSAQTGLLCEAAQVSIHHCINYYLHDNAHACMTFCCI